MIKKIIVFVCVLGLAASISPALAVKPENPGFSLPSNAIEVAPNVFSLGKVYDAQSHKMVEGYAIVHKSGNARGNSGNAKPSKAGQKCYGYLASGAKWKTVEDWEVFGGAGLNADFVLSNTSANIDKWETAAGTPSVLGTGSVGTGSITDPNILDNKNQVSFGVLDSGTIAVTIVWGIFSGPTFGRELVAWDQIYNTNFTWSNSGESGKMDFENISTHELGHAVGMGDIYTSSCSEVTMYGYGALGETAKRDLAPADVTGVSQLY
ncbi:MAG: hypothetical protein A3J46_03260 [Candidatus Yanofskybacteria bacterium RIFCSPHIGHO2_02_FULL_41_11]|uniref:Peptidase M10 metallopeptidase domain-containing protein n=2 Tax=Candidatus Yanofskyibacteriota TaxID=1752733 RepID=A0A1F8F926_9BACT|nr:MAG: hypothetical protein A2735_01680 [Candidatus Yanofskybacteria bacterium RIFCSPHIGHO2_01_FULL_41_21]OGN08746.1 MAG: hypothetical protein A3J46_03260 [Candidatus Yanofskybacteria bacterium RIFCSPHIGHO2_02_FULL_41_11]